MPYVGEDFPNATVGETITYFLDFTDTLASGETLTGASVTTAVAIDSEVNDPSAATVATGPASISGNIIGQKFENMVLGVKYLVTFTGDTSQGNVVISYTHFFTDQPT